MMHTLRSSIAPHCGLAKKLGDVGRRLGHSAVDQIEKGARRVDVDDLMALAEALNVSPITLLMPQTTKGGEPVKAGDELVQATCCPLERAEEPWDRLRALHLGSGVEDTVDYRHFFDSNPPWVIESALD